MQAIRTHFIGPTNTKPSRIVASAGSERKVYSFSELQDATGNKDHYESAHREAARRFAEQWRLQESDRLVSGTLPDGSMCHVVVGGAL